MLLNGLLGGVLETLGQGLSILDALLKVLAAQSEKTLFQGLALLLKGQKIRIFGPLPGQLGTFEFQLLAQAGLINFADDATFLDINSLMDAQQLQLPCGCGL